MKESAMRRKLILLSLITLGLASPVGADTLNMPAPSPAQSDTTDQATAPTMAQPESSPATAEATTPTSTNSDGSYSIRLPGRGMTMEQVEAKFGPPREKLPDVGDPPITRWNYDGFSVYFEYQYVIDSVSDRITQ
jgi:hypothetical protein